MCDTETDLICKSFRSLPTQRQRTTFHLQLALLRVVRIDEEVHGTGESQCELDHVEDRLVLVQPQIVVGNGHRLKGDRFGVLEKGVWAPHILQPLHLQQAIVTGHVLGQT